MDLIIHDPTVLDISDIYIEKPDRSDHSLIFFLMNCNLESNHKRQISFRNVKNVDIDSFRSDIETNLDVYLSNCNVENFSESVSLFNRVFGEIVNLHAPLITKSVEVNKKPGWIDQEFRSARSERRKLYKIWKRTKSIADRKKLELSKNEVNNMSVSKRKLYFSKCILESSNSQRDLFNICSSLLDVQKCKSLPDCEDSAKLSNVFNQYFVTENFQYQT